MCVLLLIVNVCSPWLFIIPLLSLHHPLVPDHLFRRMGGEQVNGGLGECGRYPNWLAKERVTTAFRRPQRVQNMRMGNMQHRFVSSPNTAADCPVRPALCCHSSVTLTLFGRAPSFLLPSRLFHPPLSGSLLGISWRRSLAGKAAADMAMLRCQNAALGVQCATFSGVNSNPTPPGQ